MDKSPIDNDYSVKHKLLFHIKREDKLENYLREKIRLTFL
jgi:hypothetical protein